MAIPASQIVSVTPRLIQPGGTDLAINGLLLSKNALIPLSSIALQFSSADAVGAYFGTASEEYAASVKYFLGYDNSFTKPKNFMIARRVSEAAAAYLRGAKYSGTLAALQAVSDGSLSLSINGVAYSVTAVSLSDATSFSAVATTLQTALAAELIGTTVTYSSVTGAFQITSPTSGAESTITFAGTLATGTDLGELLNLTQATGAVLSQGSDILTVADNFTKIRAVTDNWVCFTTLWAVESTEGLEYAQWANGMGVDYLYVCWSSDPLLLQQGSTTSIADVFAENNVAATTGVYNSIAQALFILGAAASIDWNRLNGTINFAFKAQSGMAASVIDATDAQTLLGKTWNLYGQYATRNDDFTFLYDGNMFGDYKFIDPYINAVWFKNVIQVAVMSGITQAGRVPYTEAGYALIRAWMMDPIKRALYNGTINTGVQLSESQKAQLVQEIGSDVSDELFTNGFVLVITDPGATIRVTRESPNISLYYAYGGSVNRISIASTVLL